MSTFGDIMPGAQIELVQMYNDPDPVRPGTCGMVLRRQWVSGHLHVDVDWDNGRTLGLVMPPDRVLVLAKATEDSEEEAYRRTLSVDERADLDMEE